jgi:putative membrane protein
VQFICAKKAKTPSYKSNLEVRPALMAPEPAAPRFDGPGIWAQNALMSVTFAALHYLALGFGFAGLFLRHFALKDALQPGGSLKRVFLGDALWGVAALLWITTGLMRAFAGLEKGTEFYLQSHWFWAKMGLFLGVFLLEMKPMTTLIRWRARKKTSLEVTDYAEARLILKLSHFEMILVFAIPFFAAIMARGGFR